MSSVVISWTGTRNELWDGAHEIRIPRLLTLLRAKLCGIGVDVIGPVVVSTVSLGSAEGDGRCCFVEYQAQLQEMSRANRNSQVTRCL